MSKSNGVKAGIRSGGAPSPTAAQMASVVTAEALGIRADSPEVLCARLADLSRRVAELERDYAACVALMASERERQMREERNRQRNEMNLEPI